MKIYVGHMTRKEGEMIRYICDLYISIGIKQDIVAAFVNATVSTLAVLGLITLQRFFLIMQELKTLKCDDVSEEKWNETIDIVIKKHEIKHIVLFVTVTYVILLTVSYLITTLR